MDSHEESDHEASFEASPSSNGPRNAPAAAMPPSPADITEVKQLVEVAMLAAMTGLAYFLAAIVKLEGYLGYFLPLPVVIASMRWGSSTGWRTVFATCCLVAVLLGPIRMLGYLCNHGLLAGTLGVAWAAGLPWAASVPICAIVRTTGMLAHLIITSWAVNENLFQLLLSNVYALLDQILSVAGSSAVPTQGAIIAVCGVLLLANALVYMTLMNVLYAVILRNMGYKGIRIPQRIERVLYPQTAAA